MLQGEMHYPEEFNLPRLVRLVQYKLKTRVAEEHFKACEGGKKKSEGWEDTVLKYKRYFWL